MNKKRNVYIAGAGKFGKKVLRMFETYGKQAWNVVAFLDNDAHKQGGTAVGIPVLPVSSDKTFDKMQDVYVFIAVLDWKMQMDLAEQLMERQIRHVYRFATSVYTEDVIFFKNEEIDFRYAIEVKRAEDGKMLPIFTYLETHVMDGCNLKCRGCTHFSNLFPTKAEVPLEIFERDILRLKEICDINRIRLLGGEPLLNKKLLQYIKVTQECFPFSDIRIVTNGLLIQRQEDTLFSYMREHGIVFDISWYPPTLNIRDEILGFLESKEVRYFASLDKIMDFSRCLTLSGCHNPEISHKICGSGQCTILRNGKLYKCPLAAYMPEYKRAFGVDIEEERGADIHHDSIGSIREFSINCVDRPIEMCRYCAEKPQAYQWACSPDPEKEEWLVQ